MEELKAGDKVIATRDIEELGIDDEIVTKAEEGTVLVIRKVLEPKNGYALRYRVSQLDMSKSFIVWPSEIRKA